MKAWNKGPRGFWLGTPPPSRFPGQQVLLGYFEMSPVGRLGPLPGILPLLPLEGGGPR